MTTKKVATMPRMRDGSFRPRRFKRLRDWRHKKRQTLLRNLEGIPRRMAKRLFREINPKDKIYKDSVE